MANMLEVEVVAVSAYSIGDPDSIQNSIRVIAGSLARVVLCTTYQVDLASIAEAADREGLLSKGYAWVLTALMDFNDIISQSPDPEKTRQRLTGWMLVANNLDDALSARFQEVFRSEPLEHLNRPRILENSVSETIVSNMDEYCAAHYDAVWTAAIAMSSMDLGEDGTVDKGALLLAIRNVSFEGASGQVLFGQDGDRDPSGVPMLLQNLRPTSRRSGSLGLSRVATWAWVSDGGESGTLSRQGAEAPCWPGGGRNWSAPADAANCADGFFFSKVSAQCEQCPPGTALRHDSCELCPLGTFSSGWGAVQCAKCQVGYTNARGMSECTPCPRNTVRGAASPGINVSECLCVVGYYSQLGVATVGTECETLTA